MNLAALKKLDVGDQVIWADPDGGGFAESMHIIEIITESGLVEDQESVVVLRDEDGHCVEAYVYELR